MNPIKRFFAKPPKTKKIENNFPIRDVPDNSLEMAAWMKEFNIGRLYSPFKPFDADGFELDKSQMTYRKRMIIKGLQNNIS